MMSVEIYDIFLRVFGSLLGLIHFGCGLVVLFFDWFLDDFGSRYQVYDNQMLWVDCKNLTNIPQYQHDIRLSAIDYCNKHIVGKDTKSMFYSNKVYFEFDFVYILGFIFLWTGIWHFIYVSPCVWNKYISEELVDGENTRLRWIEYGPSSGLMIFLIAYFIGIEDINTLVLISLMMCFAVVSTAWASSNTHCVVLPILINVIIMLLFWIRFGLLFEPTGAKFEDMPWFVTAIIVGEFIMFQSFPIVYYMEIKNYKSAYFREFLYYLLSATSKLFLGIILTFYVFIDV